ncbi:hypothetical protein HNP24_002406 [Chryseobacterium sediminis]|uniref:Uncharacterized protein n=1 Tax=Chryseobacterium sediminis TaxID=1679494 RepID=A0ABR6Q185_9FLAO|nr:hypothetical protein [Chryseobacterium sediminis]
MTLTFTGKKGGYKMINPHLFENKNRLFLSEQPVLFFIGMITQVDKLND